MMVQAKFSAKHALVLSAREVGKGRKAVGRAAAARRVTEGKIDCFVQKLYLLISSIYLNVNSYTIDTPLTTAVTFRKLFF